MQPPKPSRPTPTDRASSRARLAGALALALLLPVVAIAFAPVLVGGYLRLDDHANLLDNAHVQGFSLRGLGAVWSTSALGFYVPLTYTVWWLFAGIAGVVGELRQGAPLFHALNLVLHLANAAFVFLLCRHLIRLLAPKTSAFSDRHVTAAALVAALVFALHPAQVETVAWITELKGLLAALLGLLGLLSYYRSPRKLVAGVLFVTAMLAKPSSVFFPVIVLLIDRILLGKPLRESAKLAGLFLLPLLPLVFVTKALQPDANLELVPSPWGRLVVAADAFSFYLGKLVFPYRLALDYGRSPSFVLEHAGGGRIALALGLLAGGVALSAYALVRPPARDDGNPSWRAFALCGCAIFCASLAPVLGLVPFAFQDYTTVADHYLYVPLFGVALVVAGLVVRLRASTAALVVAATVLAVLAAATFTQARHWRSTQTLFAHTLTVNPRSYLAHYSIGTELLDAGRTDEAAARIEAAVRIRPDYLSAQVALGNAWLRQRRFQDVIDYYQSVFGRAPNVAGKRAAFVSIMHNSLGMALANVGRAAEGARHFEAAAKLDPTSLTARMNLGLFALKQGRFADAVVHYQAAVALNPGDGEARRWLDIARRGAQR